MLTRDSMSYTGLLHAKLLCQSILPSDHACVCKGYIHIFIKKAWILFQPEFLFQTPYLFYLHLTYHKIAKEVFGTNKVFVRNEMGESSYEYTVSNNGECFVLFICKC